MAPDTTPASAQDAPATSTPTKRKAGILDKLMELRESDSKERREALNQVLNEKRERAEAKRQTQLEIMHMKLDLEREKMAHEKEMMALKSEMAKHQQLQPSNPASD